MPEYNPAPLPVHPRTGLAAVGVLPSGRVVWPVLGGSGEDDVIVQDVETEASPDVEEPDEPTPDDAEPEDHDDDEPLREAGVKALKAEKARRLTAARERRQAVRERDDALAELARLQQNAGRAGESDDDALDLDAIRAEAADQAKAEARAEILAERVSDRIEVLAAKRFVDAGDALAQLMRSNDVEDFLDGGKIDAGAIKEALDELLEAKPYLAVAAQSAKRFQGSGDGGARKGPTGPSQLTEADMKRMSPEAIVKAHDEGRFTDLLGASS